MRVSAGRLFFGELPTKSREHLGPETLQVITRNRLRCRDPYCVTIAHFKHAATYGHMMFRAAIVAPASNRHRKCGEKISVAGQNAECTGIIFGTQVHDITDLNDDNERGSDGESHRVPLFAEASRSRASSRSPTM